MKSTRFRAGVFAGLMSISLTLVACLGGGGPLPAEATINGVTGIDRAAGKAALSISALDRSGNVLTSGTISGVSATVEQQGFSVTGGVCGDGAITSKGPLTGVLTLDASGSMASNDRDGLRAVAAKTFVGRMSGEDRAAITSFEGVNYYLWQDLTSDKSLLDEAIDKATYVGGGTPLWNAAIGSINFLAEAMGTNKVVLVFTDGEDTGSRSTPQDVIDRAREEDIRVFMIGLGEDIDGTAMANIATQTGGVYAPPAEEASELEVLFNNLFSASIASGCIDLVFSPVPVSGKTVSGGLSFRIQNTQFNANYSVDF